MITLEQWKDANPRSLSLNFHTRMWPAGSDKLHLINSSHLWQKACANSESSPSIWKTSGHVEAVLSTESEAHSDISKTSCPRSQTKPEQLSELEIKDLRHRGLTCWNWKGRSWHSKTIHSSVNRPSCPSGSRLTTWTLTRRLELERWSKRSVLNPSVTRQSWRLLPSLKSPHRKSSTSLLSRIWMLEKPTQLSIKIRRVK